MPRESGAMFSSVVPPMCGVQYSREHRKIMQNAIKRQPVERSVRPRSRPSRIERHQAEDEGTIESKKRRDREGVSENAGLRRRRGVQRLISSIAQASFSSPQ